MQDSGEGSSSSLPTAPPLGPMLAAFNLPLRYEARKPVGQGSFGVLIEAWDKQEQRKVAVKKVSPGGLMGWNVQEGKSLLREIRLLQHFDHENVMRLCDAFLPAGATPRADGSISDVYLVQDLMATDLHFIIQSAAKGKQQLTDEHCQYFLYQLLRGVKAIHSARVLHRDLKPSNLLVNKDCELRIADFGLARGVDANPSEANTLTEYVVTRWYRAPELLMGNENYGPSIDMCSVGCILAEMLGRTALFPGPDILATLKLVVGVLGVPDNLDFIKNEKASQYVQAIGRAQPRPPSLAERFPSAPAAAIDLLEHLLAWEPSKRITAAEALRHPYLASLHAINEEPEAPPFDFAFEGATDNELKHLLLAELGIGMDGQPETPHAVELPPITPPAAAAAKFGFQPGALTPDEAPEEAEVAAEGGRGSRAKRQRSPKSAAAAPRRGGAGR